MRSTEYVVDADRALAADPAEASLIARASRGDRDAFARLIEPRAQRLLSTARAILGNEADARDAAQDALLAAWVHLPRLRDLDRFDTWLNRTLVNKCRDAHRKRSRVHEIDLEGTTLVDRDDPESTQVGLAPAMSAFDRLSIDDRHILVLHYLHDLPVAQIACEQKIPIGTVKSRLWSARRRLQQALEAER